MTRIAVVARTTKGPICNNVKSCVHSQGVHDAHQNQHSLINLPKSYEWIGGQSLNPFQEQFMASVAEATPMRDWRLTHLANTAYAVQQAVSTAVTRRLLQILNVWTRLLNSYIPNPFLLPVTE